MNIDMHYYGTYYAARLAGFANEDAETIAWAAQMVDECDTKYIRDNHVSNGVCTIQSYTDLCLDEFKELSDPNNSALERIRGIWAPFHFLPGNMFGSDSRKPIKEFTGAKEWNGIVNFNEDRDGTDFLCMCLPNSNLVKDMIEDTKKYSFKQGEFSEENLLLIGIRMHVLADTWSHQNFVGSPNYWINEVSSWTDFNHLFEQKYAPRGVSIYDINYLGHGRVGHFPDYGCLTYRCLHRWRGTSTYVNNPERSFNAFCQMTDALTYIHKNTMNASDDTNKDFKCKRYYSDVDSIPCNVKKCMLPVLDLLHTKSTDQSTIWCNFMEEVTAGGLHIAEEPSKFSKNIQERAQIFSNQARIQRDFVQNKVNNRLKELNKPISYF